MLRQVVISFRRPPLKSLQGWRLAAKHFRCPCSRVCAPNSVLFCAKCSKVGCIRCFPSHKCKKKKLSKAAVASLECTLCRTPVQARDLKACLCARIYCRSHREAVQPCSDCDSCIFCANSCSQCTNYCMHEIGSLLVHCMVCERRVHEYHDVLVSRLSCASNSDCNCVIEPVGVCLLCRKTPEATKYLCARCNECLCPSRIPKHDLCRLCETDSRTEIVY